MKKRISIIAAAISLTIHVASAQDIAVDPGWQWARLSDAHNTYNSEQIITDTENNFISFFYYNDSVIIDDTAFYHDENYSGDNFVIIKRNSEGGFVKACDIFTTPGDFLFNTSIGTDNESNIYVLGTFSDTLFVNDTIIEMSRPGSDIYLIKLDGNFNFKWGGTVSSVYQDNCTGLEISEDNYIYLLTEHFNSLDTTHYIVNYFDQDSSDVSSGLNSLIKLDPDGRIVWRTEVRDPFDGVTNVNNTILGSDGNIYLTGYATGDIFVQGDTIFHPSYPDYPYVGFIIRFDPSGVYHHAYFIPYINFGFFYPEMKVDSSGNIITSTIISENLIFGSDTIQISNDSTYSMIAKTGPFFEPIWQKGIKTTSSTSPHFLIRLVEDSIAFAFQGKSRFTFEGNDYVLNAIGQIFSGVFNPDGILEELQTTDASIGATLHSISKDNCNNLLMDGVLRGLAHFGDDTINTGNTSQSFYAKNAHIQPFNLEMPSDTTGCGSITLYAPDGYESYYWNGLLTDENWLSVANSDIIHLKVTGENCTWSESVITVTIVPSVEFSLGSDTTILITDTLNLNAPSGFETYNWSTGDTDSALSLPASQLLAGPNIIWLEITNGPCSAFDSIQVTVIDNSGLNEIPGSNIQLIPNPAVDYINIITNSHGIPERIIIYNLHGIKLLDIRPENSIINVSHLTPGLYFAGLVFQHEVYTKKLIIQD